MAVVSMTDDELVAAELARLDAVAASPIPVGAGPAARRAGLHAHLRAYGLGHLPVDIAATILRQETLDVFTGRARHRVADTEPIWWLGVTARRAGLDWPTLPHGFEVRARTNAYLRKKIVRPVAS